MNPRDEFEQAFAAYDALHLETHCTVSTYSAVKKWQAARAALVAMATRGAVPSICTDEMLLRALEAWRKAPPDSVGAIRAAINAALAQPSEAGKDTRAKAEPCSSVAQEVEVDHWNAPHFGLTAAPSDAGKRECSCVDACHKKAGERLGDSWYCRVNAEHAARPPEDAPPRDYRCVATRGAMQCYLPDGHICDCVFDLNAAPTADDAPREVLRCHACHMAYVQPSADEYSVATAADRDPVRDTWDCAPAPTADDAGLIAEIDEALERGDDWPPEAIDDVLKRLRARIANAGEDTRPTRGKVPGVDFTDYAGYYSDPTDKR